MYPSDYGYATYRASNCLNLYMNGSNSKWVNEGECSINDWLYDKNTS